MPRKEQDLGPPPNDLFEQYPVESSAFLARSDEDRGFVLIRAGAEFARIIGRSPDECPGLTCKELVHEEDWPRLLASLVTQRPLEHGFSPCHDNVRLWIHPGRRYRPVEFNCYPVEIDGQPLLLGFLRSARISDLLSEVEIDLEEPLSLHQVPSAQDMSYVVNEAHNGQLVFHRVSNSLRDFLGHHWHTEGPTRLGPLVHEEDWPRVRDQVNAKLRKDIGYKKISSFRMLGGDDRYWEMEVHSYPVIVDGRAAILGFMRSLHDENREARDLMLHFGQLNHRLRNILTPVRSRLLVISRDTSFPENRREFLERSIEAVEDAGAVIREGLDVPRFSSFELDREGPATEVLARIFRDLQERPGDAHIEYNISIGDAQIQYNYQRLADVFQNLFDNSCREMRSISETPRIKVNVTRVGFESVIRCTWSDEGPGIPAERKEPIFQPFSSFSGGGTGLGLWIVRRAIETHRGKIEEDGEPGRGARFQIQLPILSRIAALSKPHTRSEDQ